MMCYKAGGASDAGWERGLYRVCAVLLYAAISAYSFFHGLFVHRALALACLYPFCGKMKAAAAFVFVSLAVHTLLEISRASGSGLFCAVVYYIGNMRYPEKQLGKCAAPGGILHDLLSKIAGESDSSCTTSRGFVEKLFKQEPLSMVQDQELPSDDEVFIKYKARRISELHGESGVLMELTSEAELVRKSKSDSMIVHFYKPEFRKCQIMNHNLEKACRSFPGVAFYKIRADLCNLVTERLAITVLPFLAFFRDGYFVDSVTGFEGLGDDWFEAEDLVELIRSSNFFK
ncbi:UNVERIFIED_CONTAM: hypothetical protein PYX00_011854 [Menopon gallinae]|uniref:Thioredoxin domain-containing protein 9 n=1 Tax=Menopon gallinae TaxID=328185 RepID=A0AAW2H8M5_9NEOP